MLWVWDFVRVRGLGFQGVKNWGGGYSIKLRVLEL